ncbi:MAG: single-stranded DNA-binding protein [Microthrixaceae bacterium]
MWDNNIAIAGNVGRDPELRFLASGKAVANFSVAISGGKDRDGNERETTWIEVTCWDKLAENVSESLTKGMRVSVQGRIAEDKWETDSGEKRSKTKVIADDVAASLKWATVEVNRVERFSAEDGGTRAAATRRAPAPPHPDEEPF